MVTKLLHYASVYANLLYVLGGAVGHKVLSYLYAKVKAVYASAKAEVKKVEGKL